MSVTRLFPKPVGPFPLLLTLDECMTHCRVEDMAAGPTLLGFAAAAQAWVEQATLCPLTPREMTARAAGWPCIGRRGGWEVMVRQPLSVSSIAYVDGEGADQVVPGDQFLMRDELGLMRVAFRQDFAAPATDPDEDIVLTFTAGFEAGACDPFLRAVTLLLVERFNMKRNTAMDAEEERGLLLLLAGWRLPSVA